MVHHITAIIMRSGNAFCQYKRDQMHVVAVAKGSIL